jgi:hypothetical protein
MTQQEQDQVLETLFQDTLSLSRCRDSGNSLS